MNGIQPKVLAFWCGVFVGGGFIATDAAAEPPSTEEDPFRQLEEILPSPNVYRAASGAPGHEYWQQKVDYDIAVELDDERQRLKGGATIRYENRSPLPLNYLWVQLDQNRLEPGSDNHQTTMTPEMKSMSYRQLKTAIAREKFKGGYTITKVADGRGDLLEHAVVKTMMRVDLRQPLKPGASTVVRIEWENEIVDAKTIRARGGYEYFEKDKNYVYEIAQWFPRLAAYTDVNGWQNKQFLGRGEFALEFGDYRVAITAPDDHIVASTGTLKNPAEVLTREQRERLKAAAEAEEPVMIVNLEEATANEKEKGKGKKTWVFEAENVRDFAWASSRKFLWDAMGVDVGGKTVMAMSYYPKEGEPLWSRYSTHSVAHTVEVFSKFTFDYPYPVAISVNGPVYGMEYPMICFNGPRPEEDGTYSKRTKYGLISVIIHEVGHNWFPMIVNSDERQWTWMDEGLNTFLQTLAEAEWEEDYPRRRGTPSSIVGYMSSPNQRPIMTNSESVLQFGNNAYGKPATALNILRETVMGRELFDFAFKEYSRRWMFKRPQPSDFFRSMEDASGIDLDWFWRGWFYTTKRVDLAITGVKRFDLDARDPDVEKPKQKAKRDEELAKNVSRERDKTLKKYTDGRPGLLDFYNEYDELDVTAKERDSYEKLLEELEPWERELLKTQRHFYVVEFENVGGLVMPVILDVTYEGGSRETLRLPAEVWKSDGRSTSKLILAKKEIVKLELDPRRETADTNVENNYWPPRMVEERFQLNGDDDKPNPMQEAKEAAEKAAAEAEKKAEGKEKKTGKE